MVLPGLGKGHAYGSFQHPDTTSTYNWLIDSLPRDCPSIRVISYGYDSKVENSTSTQDIESLSTGFRVALKKIRQGAADKQVSIRLIGDLH